jgi:hypothetical protein
MNSFGSKFDFVIQTQRQAKRYALLPVIIFTTLLTPTFIGCKGNPDPAHQEKDTKDSFFGIYLGQGKAWHEY